MTARQKFLEIYSNYFFKSFLSSFEMCFQKNFYGLLISSSQIFQLLFIRLIFFTSLDFCVNIFIMRVNELIFMCRDKYVNFNIEKFNYSSNLPQKFYFYLNCNVFVVLRVLQACFFYKSNNRVLNLVRVITSLEFFLTRNTIIIIMTNYLKSSMVN